MRLAHAAENNPARQAAGSMSTRTLTRIETAKQANASPVERASRLPNSVPCWRLLPTMMPTPITAASIASQPGAPHKLAQQEPAEDRGKEDLRGLQEDGGGDRGR